jgi:hypothetical protein
MNQKLVDFYTGNGKDEAGRTFDDIMAFNDEQLENVHDYIQWIFPTLTPSKAQPQSPILDKLTIKSLRRNGVFYARFIQAIEFIFRFWEIPIQDDIPTDNINKEGFKWLLRDDHNQLRIARVLESTRLLGLKGVSIDLFHKLVKFCGTTQPYQHYLTARNMAYWYQAASGVKLMG